MAASLKVSEGVLVAASQEPASPHVQSALPPKVKGRNFIPEKDCQLYRSVLHVSQDPRIGTWQKKGSFWERISTHFNEVAVVGKRPTRSLESKWSSIKHDVSKFVGIHSQVENLRRNGVSESDILAEALELYKLKHPKGHSFTFLHCWYLLRSVPRWVDGSVTECRKFPVVPTKVRGHREMHHSNDSNLDSASPNLPIREVASKQRLRPQGNKAVKEEYKN
jgi:hypothetical protein